jgi:hypothetical protein
VSQAPRFTWRYFCADIIRCRGMSRHGIGPLESLPTTDNDRSWPALSETLRIGLVTKNQQLSSELRALPGS